ncbi:hypothetical protein SELMODRAFT_408972 [Selaginella moellendorffii]|uniref:Uncharacterized protein n=1 Tax=Selaginella moellendorffii TaxID=88036 RepID=D8R923_SELML|nr:hypothetical protein SELMODRAFT_408972 [Selaginella moellendorffii]
MTKAHTLSGKLFKLWRQFKYKLEHRPPHTKEQLDRQPIFLSKLLTVNDSLFSSQTLNLQEDQHHRWWKVDELIVCTLPNMASRLIFKVGQAGCLYPIVSPEYEDLLDMSRAKPIRVIQMEKKTANVDPLILEQQYARLYWFRQQTLDELKWDPVEWRWRGTMCKGSFQYETKLGLKLIRVPTRSSLIRKAKAQQIPSRNHSRCINMIWKGRWSAKNRYFMWLAQQERLPSLAAIHLPNTACKTYGATET